MLTFLARCEGWPSCIPGPAFDVLCSTEMRAGLSRSCAGSGHIPRDYFIFSPESSLSLDGISAGGYKILSKTPSSVAFIVVLYLTSNTDPILFFMINY